MGAVGAFLLANFLFTEPVHTLAVVDPKEWLEPPFFLLVGVVVGQLAGRQRDRAEIAELRERRPGILPGEPCARDGRGHGQAMRDVVRILQAETSMARVWIGFHGPARRGVVADTGLGNEPAAQPATSCSSEPRGTNRPAGSPSMPRAVAPIGSGTNLAAYRVMIEVGERPLGSIWALRPRSSGCRAARKPGCSRPPPINRPGARAGPATAGRASLEVARQSEALKSALSIGLPRPADADRHDPRRGRQPPGR